MARPAVTVVASPVWGALARTHADRADRLMGEAVTASGRDAVTAFLFTYYSLRPAALRRWHPGAGVGLVDAHEHRSWRWYRTRDGVTALDLDAHLAERGDVVRAQAALLSAVAERPARHDCFGLHEWAMVYRDTRTRHALPLRLGGAGTDAVVESATLRCTHFDAYRFFTEAARPRNQEVLDRAGQVDRDQPGCLHVTMDLYRIAYRLGPLVPGELLLDCFELARRARLVDMRASPYDLGTLGHVPIRVETPEGRAEYAARQRELTASAAPLRRRLLAVVEAALDHC